VECSPILGTGVPDFDQFDIATLEAENSQPIQIRNESKISPTNFGSDTVESMAGISVDDLTSGGQNLPDELLDVNSPEKTQIDMSALSVEQQKPAKQSDVELPDDLLDFD
jgi:hypothetical protein